MSYGIWRKRGQGWCSIEIDTPGNGTQLYELKYENELSHKLLVSGLRNNDIRFDGYCDYLDDYRDYLEILFCPLY